MPPFVKLGTKTIGDGNPLYIIAEIGINHNGDLNIAKKLIDLAAVAGCDAVKFQKRTPDICVPTEQRNIMRDTPWGTMKYIDYRHRLELGIQEYKEIDRHCSKRNIDWFASCWDRASVEFLEQFNPICFKIPSACLTDDKLLKHVNLTDRPILLSTGMSTMEEIRNAVSMLDRSRLIIMHTTSTYPCKPNEINLKMIQTLQKEFNCPIGYSGHEPGLQITYAAAALGASIIERHITLDHHMWGTDHTASVEGTGLLRLVRDIRVIEDALGDGMKKVYEGERAMIQKLRRFKNDLFEMKAVILKSS